MLRHWIPTGIALALAFTLGLARDARAGDKFEAHLDGANEVPPVATDTFGKAEIAFDDGEAEVEIEVRDGVRITMAHIHCAPAGVNGPIVVWLAGIAPPLTPPGDASQGYEVDGGWIENEVVTDENVRPTSGSGPCPEVITDLDSLREAARNGNAYVNVHSVAHPGGVVRGQLVED